MSGFAKKVGLVMLFALFSLAQTIPVIAQTSTGEIDVTVADASGAVIPNATVSIIGANTGNIARQLTTNAEGIERGNQFCIR